ncbi:MAG TPA: hypothetical protein VHD85_14705 [Terracidiphilus sp.]|nr:hypothetical protein [Terracidiphilus sp.]
MRQRQNILVSLCGNDGTAPASLTLTYLTIESNNDDPASLPFKHVPRCSQAIEGSLF